MSLRAALRRLWCRLTHARGLWCRHCNPAPVPPLELPEGLRFNWLRDYGPLWEPGSTAFWLEPETCDELAAWFARYQPHVTGVVEAAGLRIEIAPALSPNAIYANLRQSQYLNQYTLLAQTGLLTEYYKNSPRNKLPGGWN